MSAEKRRPSRATAMMGAVADAPAKSPILYWILGVAVMGYGIYRMEQHPHPSANYVHMGSDWALIALGIVFIPGAARKVIDFVAGLAPYVPFLKKPKADE